MKPSQVAIIEKHPLWIRWTHWINFPLLGLMAWSGILIYWANRVYFPSLPSGLYESLHLDHRLALGMAVHFTLMWLLVINGVLYLAYLAFSGEWRELCPRPRDFRDALYVTLHDLGLRKAAPPQAKFNAAQKIAYSGVVLMGLGSVLTGLAIYKPVQAQGLARLFFGYEGARLVHYGLLVLFILFFGVHVAQVIRAGWNNFRAMIAGYEIQEPHDSE